MVLKIHMTGMSNVYFSLANSFAIFLNIKKFLIYRHPRVLTVLLIFLILLFMIVDYNIAFMIDFT